MSDEGGEEKPDKQTAELLLTLAGKELIKHGGRFLNHPVHLFTSQTKTLSIYYTYI